MGVTVWTSQLWSAVGGALNAGGAAAQGSALAQEPAAAIDLDDPLIGLTYGADLGAYPFDQSQFERKPPPKSPVAAGKRSSGIFGFQEKMGSFGAFSVGAARAVGTTTAEAVKPTALEKVTVAHVRFARVSDGCVFEIDAVEGGEAWKIENTARIFYRSGFVFLEAVDRRRLVSINNEKIPPHMEVPLAEGDRVQICGQEYIVSDSGSLAKIEYLEMEPAMIPDILFIQKELGPTAGLKEKGFFLLGEEPVFHPFGIQGVRIFPSGDDVFIADLRDEERLTTFEESRSGLYLFKPDFHEIAVNGRPFTGIRNLEGGDQFRCYVYSAVIAFPRQLIGKMADMPKWRQRVIAAQIANAENYDELETALSRAADFGSAFLINKVTQVMAAYPGSSIYALPTEWGIRQKILELMKEEIRERLRKKMPPPQTWLKSESEERIVHRLEKELAWVLAIEALEMRIGRAQNPEELAQDLCDSRLEMLAGQSVRGLAECLKEAAALGEYNPNDFPEELGLRKKVTDLLPNNGMGAIREKIDNACSMRELTDMLEASDLSSLGDWPMRRLLKTMEAIASWQGNGIQDLPRLGGLRQKVRDLMEHANLERAVELAKKGEKILPENRRLKKTIILMDEEEEKLYAGPDAKQKEKIYFVLDRGKPLAILTRENGLRERAVIFMRNVIQTASQLFPKEMHVSSNPFSGERIASENFETQYRLARMVLNHYAGRPLRGAPTEEEMGIGQIDLRRMVDRLDPKVVSLLRDSTPEQKAFLLEAYFGDYQHRDMSSAARAFRVAALFGLSGLYREVGVTYALENGTWRANISLGDLGSVRSEEHGRFFILHTHPEEYLDKEGGMMGAELGGGGKDAGKGARTVRLSQVDGVYRSSRNILFSNQDVEIFVKDAARYTSRHRFSSFLTPTSLYDATERVYKNWVVHPFGGSEMNVVMLGNVPRKAIILFARNRSKPMDNSYKHQKEKLLTLIREELKLEADIREISYEDFQQSLPFPVF